MCDRNSSNSRARPACSQSFLSHNSDRTQAFVKSLVEHHGLSVKMTSPDAMKISLPWLSATQHNASLFKLGGQ